MIELVPRGAADRALPHADQPPPRRPRDRVHRRATATPRCSSATSGSPSALTAAADEASFPADRRFAIGTIAGFRPFSELNDGQPDTRPSDRTAGAPMNYTSGTTGEPKGVKRGARRHRPGRDGRAVLACSSCCSACRPSDGNVHITGSPLYHTAVLLWTANSLHIGHTVVLMDKWTPEGMLRARSSKHRVTTSHMVPTQFHRLLALPDDVQRASTTCRRCGTWCTPPRRARPRSSAG